MAIHYTNNLVYWHMPKTGGMSVYKYLRAHGEGYASVNGVRRHDRASKIPSSIFTKRCLFGTVRDPWSWYTSLYQHASSDPRGFKSLGLFGGGSIDFKRVLFGMTHPLEIIETPVHFGIAFDFQKGEEEQALHDFMGSGLGLCSWVFRWVYGRPARPEVFVDTHQLTDGLSQLLFCDESELKKIGAQNRSEHRPKTHIPRPSELYDEEMIRWVLEADRPLIETFEFEFFSPTKKPVILSSDLRFPSSMR